MNNKEALKRMINSRTIGRCGGKTYQLKKHVEELRRKGHKVIMGSKKSCEGCNPNIIDDFIFPHVIFDETLDEVFMDMLSPTLPEE